MNDQTSVRDLPKYRVMKVKITKSESIVRMHACILGWSTILKNWVAPNKVTVFLPDMKMLKVHHNAPRSLLKSKKISGTDTRGPPYYKGRRGVERGGGESEGEGRGWVGLGKVGKGGNRCLAYPKIIPWRPL
jgi:hypothetical protein